MKQQLDSKIFSRRNLLKGLAISGVAGLYGKKVLAQACSIPTPEQTEGPFYPVADRLDKDNDLTRVRGRSSSALGEIIFIQGKVLDKNCRPVAGALVEIWQACASGKYDHPGDPNSAPLDHDFQYWGRSVSNQQGEYNFKTILPGAYPANNTWMRPPHIHFKVFFGERELLTSQFYFKGQELNTSDRIFMSLPEAERERVLVDLVQNGSGRRVGEFNINLENF